MAPKRAKDLKKMVSIKKPTHLSVDKKTENTTEQIQQIFEKVKLALENNKYKYRTFEGVSRETKVNIEKIHQVIQKHPEEVVVLYRTGKNGERLITTRKHYEQKASIPEKIFSTVLNKIY